MTHDEVRDLWWKMHRHCDVDNQANLLHGPALYSGWKTVYLPVARQQYGALPRVFAVHPQNQTQATTGLRFDRVAAIWMPRSAPDPAKMTRAATSPAAPASTGWMEAFPAFRR